MGSERPAENRISYLPARLLATCKLYETGPKGDFIIPRAAREIESENAAGTAFRFRSHRTIHPLHEVSSPIKTRSCFSLNPDISFFLLCFVSLPPCPSLSSLSPSFPLPRYIKLGAGEASDNRFNRWTVKEIVASTPSRSHNVKSTGERERERGRERDLSTEGKEKFDFRQGSIVVFRRKTSVVNYLLGVSGSWTGQLGRRDSNAWLIDRRNKIRRVGGYFSGNLWPGISRWTFFLVGRRRNRCYAKWRGWRRKLNLIFDV